MGGSARYARSRIAPADARALYDESRATLDVVASVLPHLDRLGGAADLAATCERLRDQIGRDVAVIEVEGARRGDVIEALAGVSIVAAEPAPGVSVQVRPARELDYVARWPDGRQERPPPDRAEELDAELARLEAAVAVEETQLGRIAGQRRALLAPASPEPVRIAPPVATTATAPRRSLLARLWAFILRLLGRRDPPALPAPPPVDEVAAARDRRAAAVEEHAGRLAAVEAELLACEGRLGALVADRERRREERERQGAERLRRLRARLIELTSDLRASAVEIEIGCPGIPDGVVLLLRSPLQLWREPVAGVLVGDGAPAAELRARVQRLAEDKPAEVARRAAALSCSCRNRILDLEKRARQAHDARIGELAARRMAATAALRDEQLATAKLPVARHADEIVNAAASQLERLVEEARLGWEQRIEGCVGVEQLRAEVAAIEDGAAHRLSLVCEELRETMTIQFVRLVLELAAPLRQELSKKRLEVARGRSTKVEEAFEDIRFNFPATLDAAFAALRAPGVGQLMTSERGLFESLFRTLARDKRECVTRLRARLDEIQQATARELYASAVAVSPLLSTTLGRLLDELLAAHERWIEARVSEEQRAYDEVRARHQPALDEVPRLEEAEARLAARLEAGASG